MTINYLPLTIDPNPLQGEPNKEYKLTAKSKGSAPKSSKYVWDFGDGSSQVTKQNDSLVTHTYSKEGTFPIKVELYDNSTNAKIADATSVAQISINSQSSKSFSYNWVRTNSLWPRFKVNYNISGTVEGLNGNKIMSVSNNKDIDYVVDIKFSELGAFKVTFNSSFSVSPTKIDTTYADGTSQVFSVEGNSRMLWYTQNFSPYTYNETGIGVFENSNSFGQILITGIFDTKIVEFDKDQNQFGTITGPCIWDLIHMQFGKQ